MKPLMVIAALAWPGWASAQQVDVSKALLEAFMWHTPPAGQAQVSKALLEVWALVVIPPSGGTNFIHVPVPGR